MDLDLPLLKEKQPRHHIREELMARLFFLIRFLTILSKAIDENNLRR